METIRRGRRHLASRTTDAAQVVIYFRARCGALASGESGRPKIRCCVLLFRSNITRTVAARLRLFGVRIYILYRVIILP